MKNSFSFFLVAISAFFVADLAVATGGADSLFPLMRIGGYLLHLLAIFGGVVGLIVLKRELVLFGKFRLLIFMLVLFLFVPLLGYHIASQHTTNLFSEKVPLAIKNGSIAGVPNDFEKCIKGTSQISVKIVGGVGLLQFYLLDVRCEAKATQIVAKRHPSSWVYFMDPPENKK